MLTTYNEKHLIGAIKSNSCVLFLGAGFSSGASNSLGTPIPTGYDLARQLWLWLGYEGTHGAYVDAPLDRLFDIARRERGEAALLEFLRDRIIVKETPEWYRTIGDPFWHRIYTTNVDTLLEGIFRQEGRHKLDVLNGTKDRYRDRDPFLGSIQYVKLNGSITDSLDHITFGTRQYGRRASEYDPWYDHFVRDYSQHVTILIGTRVSEPLFWQALEARKGRHGAAKELRLRSFLVSKRLDPVVLSSLDDFNVVPVEASAEEFLAYLKDRLGDLQSREEILQKIAPEVSQVVSTAARNPDDRDALESFLRAFSRVSVTDPPRSHRSLFHHGATPTWDDLALGLDAKREVTADAQAAIQSDVDAAGRSQPSIVTGHRGAGKSTLVMRCALNLAATGFPVFYAAGEDIPEHHIIGRALDALPTKVVLVIDDAEWVSGKLDLLRDTLAKCRVPPVLVVALRANALHAVQERGEFKEVWLRELTDNDIEAVIDVLEKANTLGTMTGKPRDVIRAAFKSKARKQLLVALKEVTSGLPFNEIIRREFQDINELELRITYAIACLATDAGSSLNRGQLIASSQLPPAVLMSALDRELNGMLVAVTEHGDRMIARHPIIAASVVEKAVTKTVLATAYRRILGVLANDMDSRARSGEPRRWFRLFMQLIKHDVIYHRFERNIDEARGIYDALTEKLSDDAHFWIQYGSLELEYGELELASRYVASAEGLAPNLRIIRTTKAHLVFAQAVAAHSLSEASALRFEATDLCENLIDDYGEETSYPWHILITHTLDWLDSWEPDPKARRAELEKLRHRAAEACEARPRSEELQEARQRVEKAYLNTAL